MAKQRFSQCAGQLMQRIRNFMMDYAYLMTLGAAIAIIAASAMFTQQIRTQGHTSVQAAADAPEIEAEQTPKPTILPIHTPAPLTVNMPVLSAGMVSTVWPLSGDVLRGYDEKRLVYWETLSCFAVHAALDIAGVTDEAVHCARDGVVERTMRDDLWGWRVTVTQMDGRIAEYAGLSVCDVTAGQSVTRGQTLGTLMASIPCEAELGTHLHLTLKKENELCDPLEMLP